MALMVPSQMALMVPSQYSHGICKSLIFDIKSNSGANYKLLVLLLLLKLAILINGPIIKSYFEWISTVWTHRSSSVFWQYPKTTHIWKATQFYFVRYLSMHLIQCGDHFSLRLWLWPQIVLLKFGFKINFIIFRILKPWRSFSLQRLHILFYWRLMWHLIMWSDIVDLACNWIVDKKNFGPSIVSSKLSGYLVLSLSL